MTGPVEWSIVYLISAIIVVGAGVAATLAGVAWNMRGVQARLEEKIMLTAQIVTDKISDSRHFLRNEMHGELAKLENEFQTGLGKIENEMTSVAAKLDMHRADDAKVFQEMGERLARLEAGE